MSRPRLAPRLLAGIWSIPAVLSTFETIVFSALAGRPMPVWKAFVAEAPGWYTWALLTPVVLRLGDRWRLDASGETGGDAPRGRRWRAANVALHLLFAASCAALVAVVNAGVNGYVRPNRFGFLWSVRSWFLSGLPANVVAYFGILAISHALVTALALRERERDAAQLRAQLSEAQVSALRMQLNPHFLFNSLNAVMALVRDGAREEAVNALSGISDLLRTALRDQSHTTSLAEELAFTRRYLDVERVRFADRLQVVLDVPDALADARVPTFVLQPLIENALRHGIGTLRDGGRLRVSAREETGALVLRVENDGPSPEHSVPREGDPGVGVANTRARLARMYGERGAFTLTAGEDGQGAVATIRLPIARADRPRMAAP